MENCYHFPGVWSTHGSRHALLHSFPYGYTVQHPIRSSTIHICSSAGHLTAQHSAVRYRAGAAVRRSQRLETLSLTPCHPRTSRSSDLVRLWEGNKQGNDSQTHQLIYLYLWDSPFDLILLFRLFDQTIALVLLMGPNLVALAASIREALASPQTLVAETKEDKDARLDIIDMMPELNRALLGEVHALRELAWSVCVDCVLLLHQMPPLGS